MKILSKPILSWWVRAGLDFESLTTGINLILKRGAQLICTNPDISVDAVRNQQHVVFPGRGGKPASGLYLMVLDRLGVTPENCVIIGDRPDTDILGAQSLSMRTALVRTGRFLTKNSLPNNIQPDWDVANLEELFSCWKP